MLKGNKMLFFFLLLKCWLLCGTRYPPVTRSRHCSSPTGSMDGRIVVEEDGGEAADLTTLTWQIGLGETLCYRFKSETSSLVGKVEVTYVSLKSIYSILDSYHFDNEVMVALRPYL